MKAHPRVVRMLRSHRHEELAISVVTESELRFGAVKSGQPRNAEALESWLMRLQIVDFTSTEAIVYALIRAYLEHAGHPIGPLDLLIAAHALALDLVLVTNNVREFRRVPRLKVENWTA